MIRLTAHAILSGPHFSPQKALSTTGLALSKRIEPSYPTSHESTVREGSAILVAPVAEDGFHGLEQLLKSIDLGYAGLNAAGLDEITVFLNVAYREQCNFELGASLTLLLANIGATIAVSCYPDDGS